MLDFRPPTYGDAIVGATPPVRQQPTATFTRDIFVPPLIQDALPQPAPETQRLNITMPDNAIPPSAQDDPAGFMDQPPVRPLMQPDKPVDLPELAYNTSSRFEDSPPKGGNVE
jgi:hypothetical protein